LTRLTGCVKCAPKKYPNLKYRKDAAGPTAYMETRTAMGVAPAGRPTAYANRRGWAATPTAREEHSTAKRTFPLCSFAIQFTLVTTIFTEVASRPNQPADAEPAASPIIDMQQGPLTQAAGKRPFKIPRRCRSAGEMPETDPGPLRHAGFSYFDSTSRKSRS